jgi:serine O-acetyltransferase
MSAFWQVVRADLHRVVSENETSVRRELAVIWSEMGLQAVLVYRFGQLLRSGTRRILAWPLLPVGWALYGLAILVIRSCYGIRLSLSAQIGPGFCVQHFGGIEVINCRLGERCSVAQQTKVGRAQDSAGPQVGNGVWIGAHARIFGAVRVGDGTTIAPGARVMRNVPDKALVAGDPARVVFRGYDNTQILPVPDRTPAAAAPHART